MKRSKEIQGRMIFLIFMVLLVLGLVIPSTVTAETEDNTNQGIIAQSGDQAIQPLADVDCYAGNSYTLSGTIYNYNGTSNLTFFSSDTNIVKITAQSTTILTINSKMNVNYAINFDAVSAGEVTIQGIDDTGAVKMTRKIIILAPDPTSISLLKSDYSVDVGKSVKVKVAVSPALADQHVTYKIKDSNIASVDEDGKVTGIKAGKTTLTATTINGISTTTAIFVYDPIKSFVLDYTQMTLIKGSSAELKATIEPATAQQNIFWTSSNNEIAGINTVSSTTVEISSGSVGTAVITATSNDGEYSATCLVTVVYDDVSKVSIDQNSITLLLGQSETLFATVYPDSADPTVSWETSNPEIVSVTNGEISGISAGTATITAKTANGKTASCEVTVIPPDVSSIILSEYDLILTKGDTETLTTEIRPSGAFSNIDWESSDSKIVTVSDGKITAISAGTATITAKASNGITATCTVTVILPEVSSVSLSKSELILTKGNEATLTATIEPSDASQEVTWSSSDSSIATVTDGKITGIAAGTTSITAEASNGKTATCTITVILPEAISISLDQTSLRLEKGNNATLTAVVSPSDASQDVSWSSSDDSVATVTDEGTINAVSAGSAIITAKTSNEKTAVCTVTVSVPEATSVTLNLTSITLEAGQTSTLVAKVNPSDASQSVSWSSSDLKVAHVSNGTVKGISIGTATITAKTSNGITVTCLVTVKEAESIPIYRLYMPSTGEHLYTSDKHEYDILYQKYGWGQEGIGWYAPSSGTAVYRLYQPGLKNHLYTTDKNEVKVLTSKYGWVTDNGGEALYYSGGSVPIYRVYNKGLNGMHHLTTDTNEYNTLPKFGWQQEGATLYATKLGSPYATTKFYK